MKIKKVTLANNETSVEFDLFSDLAKKITKDQKEKIISEVGDFLVEQTLLSAADEKSPVVGGKWKKGLSKPYAKIKKDEIGNTNADLQFSGRMLDQVKAVPTKEGFKLGVFGERAPAADGHNNLSGKSKLPQRKFLPGEGENYKAPIEREVKRIVADIVAETADTKIEKSLKQVESKAELYEELSDIFGDLSRAELKLAVFRNKNVYEILDDNDLLDLL